MLKREIISLLKYRKEELNSHYGDKPGYDTNSKRREDILDYELPNVDEIKEEIEILNKELTSIKKGKEESHTKRIFLEPSNARERFSMPLYIV